MINEDNVFLLTQSIIAVVVVVGGGAFVFLKPDSSQVVMGVIGIVIGWYFRGATTNQSAKVATRMQASALAALSQVQKATAAVRK